MRLIIAPASHARRLCEEARPSHLLRFVSPDQAVSSNLVADEILTLVMHDITQLRAGHLAPDAAMITTLLDFSRNWSGERPLIAQCWAGVSRSPAAAFIIACDKRPDVPEAVLANALRLAAPQATPNWLMVAHADALLRRAGRMIAAARAIGRGAEFSDFVCANLDLGHPTADASRGIFGTPRLNG